MLTQPEPSSIGARLFRLAHLLERIGDRHLQENYSITFSRYQVLAAATQRGEVSQAQLCSELGVSAPVISRMLPSLESAGLIAVRDDEAHGKRRIVTVTPHGKQLVASATAELESHLAQVAQSAEVDLTRFGADTVSLRHALLRDGDGQSVRVGR